MSEYRMYGPPGTGKTTAVSHWIRQIVQKYGSGSVLVASFTRSAAQTLVQRNLPLDRWQIGTLHSHAYRAIGTSTIAEKDLIGEWNSLHPGKLELSVNGADIDDTIEGNAATEGDQLFNIVQTYRARMIPEDRWPNPRAAYFHRLWEQFKQETGSIDFTDMIDLAYKEVARPLGNPRFGFYDEVQDFTPLELALIRKWSANMEHIVLAGDDDQSIYGFKGATPNAFLDPPIPDAQKRVLAQSYRVPWEVHALAQDWILRVTRREPKDYAPRPENGEVRFASRLTLYRADALVLDAEQYLSAGKSVYFLATCGYMLESLKKALRNMGVPFHNPYKRRRGDWNPLHPSKGTPMSYRLLAYLAGSQRAELSWTGEELKRWVPVLKQDGVLMRGAKKAIESTANERMVKAQELKRWFEQEALEEMTKGNPRWLLNHALASNQKSLEFPTKIVSQRGAEELVSEPQILIGTIHSVKGAEADVVYVFPDVSPNGLDSWNEVGPSRDEVIRLMYVAFTRAKETLVIGGPSTPYTIELPSALPAGTELEL